MTKSLSIRRTSHEGQNKGARLQRTFLLSFLNWDFFFPISIITGIAGDFFLQHLWSKDKYKSSLGTHNVQQVFIAAESCICIEVLLILFSNCWVLYENKDAIPVRRCWLGRLWLGSVYFKNKQRLNLFTQDLEAYPDISKSEGKQWQNEWKKYFRQHFDFWHL